jgi:hypothetical protein
MGSVVATEAAKTPTAAMTKAKAHDDTDRARRLQLATEGQLRLFGEATRHLLVVDMRRSPATPGSVQGSFEGIDDLGVELPSGVAAQLGQGVLLGECHPV